MDWVAGLLVVIAFMLYQLVKFAEKIHNSLKELRAEVRWQFSRDGDDPFSAETAKGFTVMESLDMIRHYLREADEARISEDITRRHPPPTEEQ